MLLIAVEIARAPYGFLEQTSRRELIRRAPHQVTGAAVASSFTQPPPVPANPHLRRAELAAVSFTRPIR